MSLSVKTQGGGGGFFASILVDGLKETDTVYATKQEIVPASDVPDGYTQLEYIESTGTQHVETGIFPDSNTRIVAEMEATSGVTGFLFGSRTNSTVTLSSCSFSMAQINGTSLRSDYGGVETEILRAPLQRLLIDKNGNVTTVNGTSVTAEVREFSGAYPIVLFSVNTAGNATSGRAAAKLYSCQIYADGTLVRDYVPCINPAGAVGLYDLVSGAFYGNAGTGSFVSGPVAYVDGNKTKPGKWGAAPNPKIVVPYGYTQLEHIESTGTQYVDTNFLPNQDTRAVVDAEFTGIGSSFYILGARKAWQDTMFAIYAESSGTQFTFGHGTQTGKANATVISRHVFDLNRNSVYVDGALGVALTANTFQSQNSLYLFSCNQNGAPMSYTENLRIYACQIYDNGTLVRDYVPCKNPAGEIGLYDLVSAAFFPNLGTGVFIAGPEIAATVEGFIIPRINDLGLWKVTATDGVKTVTEYVLVDAATQFDIFMDLYRVWLYREGDECEDVTGGWKGGFAPDRTNYTAGTLTKLDDNMVVTCPTTNGWWQAICCTSIDLISCGRPAKLCIDFIPKVGGSHTPTVVISRDGKIDNNLCLFTPTTTTRHTAEVDVSAIDGAVYIAIVTAHGSCATIYNIWLE